MGVQSLLALAGATAIASYLKLSGASSVAILLSLLGTLITELALCLAFSSLVYRWFLSPTKDLPHPKDTPFLLGNLIPFLSEPWGMPLARWQLTVPPTASGFYRVFLGPFDYLIPKSSQAVSTIMSQPYLYHKPAAVRDGLVESLGVGLVAAEGSVHKKQKKLLTPIFGMSRNRRLVPQMWTKALTLATKIQELVAETGSKSAVLNMHPLTMAATLDVIGVTTLGVDFDSVTRPDQPILQAYQRVFPSFENQSAVEKFFGATLPAIISPHLLFKLPFKPIREFHQGMTALQDFCLTQIRQKRQQIEEAEDGSDEIREKDILSAIIAAGLEDESEILSHILTVLAAGHESTAITLAWAIFKLAQHPDVQDKLRAEVFAATRSANPEGLTLENISSMKYLRCFLMEVLRLYPAFPAMMREAAHDTRVGDLLIPKGKQIMVSPYAVNRSQELWGDDADEFKVERWEDSYSGGAKTSQAFLTFSSGPRVCIGKDFATLSLKVFLTVLVSKLKFEEAIPGWHPVIQKGTSLKPQGLKVKVSLL
ncbi:cytochrome P450 [Trichoderma citrinoviride]|uniref:Cytochrome P450 n=1 Tax=Trichoderma citrinoviride TaxID=58853 RepID=A0A2T4AYH8_9HYPO|nr:cytochrome P450 [Trichoderma citrinoviride]PTB62120.1 cytochrome P450 [Trichoderma citrinoviride]